MQTKALCDRCKREFECDEEEVDTLRELLCPNCKEDSNLE